MTLDRSEVVALLGPNGSGKTTTIRMMCGLMRPTAGRVTVLGMSVPEQAVIVRRHVGYLRLQTEQEVELLNQLYDRLRLLINGRLNERHPGFPMEDQGAFINDFVKTLVRAFQIRPSVD